MKNILATLLLCSLSSIQAQTISDYKYVIVSKNFNGFEENQYGLNNRVRYNLEQKNYQVLSEDQSAWPQEIQNNPCMAATANVNKKKSMLTNKLEVVFTNCSQINLGNYEGNSRIKDYDKGFQEAVKLAFVKVPNQNAIENHENITTKTSVVAPEVVKQTQTKQDVKETKKEIPANSYTSEGKQFQVASVGNNSFILISQDSDKIVAKFYPSSLPNVYHVEVITDKGNYNTIGYLRDNQIIIENKTGDKSWSTTTFTK